MHISVTVEVAALSADGGAALLVRGGHGPEGGGSLGYEVVGRGDGFAGTVSSTYSPGDGSEPEVVAAAACRAVARRLAELTADFPGVSVRPGACGGDRRAVVTLAPEAWSGARAARAPALPERVQVAPGAVTVDGVALALAPDERVTAWVTASLLLVVAETDSASRLVWPSPRPGQPQGK